MAPRRKCPDCGAALPRGHARTDCPKCGALLRPARTGRGPGAKPAAKASPPPPVSSDEPTLPKPGTRLGEFELGAVIALSSRAVVYEAKPSSGGDDAVCKLFLEPAADDESGLTALRDLLDRVSRIDDAAVAGIREIGEHQGRLFIAMDRADGEAVRFDGSQTPLPPSLAARLVERLARALHAAHRQGVVHPGLADGHVILNGPEGVCLLGLASADQPAETEEPALLPVPIGALPPECAGNGGAPPSVRSNVHSLGTVLYVLLTGSPPFRAATAAETLRLVRDCDPPSPELVNPLVPRELAAIVRRCLAREPGRRYDNAQELAADLGRFLHCESSRGTRRPWPQRLGAAMRRHPGRAFATILLAGGLLAAGMGGWNELRNWRERHASLLLERAVSNRLVGKRDAALALIGEAARIRSDARTRQVAIETLTIPELRRVTGIPVTEACQVRFSADGLLLAVAGISPGSRGAPAPTRSPTVRVHDLANDRTLGELPWALEAGPVAFHPNDPWLAVPQADGTTALWTPRAGVPPSYLPAGGIPLFNREGTRLVLDASGTNAVVVALATLQREARLEGVRPVCWISDDELLIRGPEGVESWRISSNHRRILAGAGQRLLAVAPEAGIAAWQIPDTLGAVGSLSLRSLEDQGEIWRPEGLSAGLASPLFLFRAQGSQAFVGDRLDPSLMRVLDVSKRRHLGSLSLPGARFGSDQPAARSPGANASTSWRERMPALDDAHPDRELASAITRDGRLLAVTLKNQEEWAVEVQDLQEGRLLASLPGARRPVWSPDDRLLAVVRPAGGTTAAEPASETVDIWELRIPAPGLHLAQPVRQVAFARDGSQLAAGGRTIELRYFGGRPTLVDTGDERAGLVLGADANGGEWGAAAVLVAGTLPLEVKSSAGEIRTLPKKGDLTRLAFAPDGGRLLLAHGAMRPGEASATGATNHFEVWNLWRGEREAVWPAPPGVASGGPIAFSPDGGRVASAFFQTEGLELIDARTGERERLLLTAASEEPRDIGEDEMFRLLSTPIPRHAVRAVRFDEEGQRLFVGTTAGWLCVIACGSGHALFARPAHEGEITALALQPKGRLAATSGKDGLVRLHRLPDGEELARWRGPKQWLSALEFSPDGKLLVAGSEDGLLQLWDVSAIREGLAELGLDW